MVVVHNNDDLGMLGPAHFKRCIDSTLMILLNLPVPLKRELDRLARKREIPENCMDRYWVISELIRLESRSLPEFTFWKRNKTPDP